MIEFKKLRKVYKSLNGGKCVALNDIDIQLPDTGLVFIIGKSGSGKSTLLNLLGGLDTITSGDIIADGNSLSSFNKKDFENYRSTYIGFVFQHYYLLDELTVKQNVEMAMGIIGNDDQKKVDDLLAKVGLTGYEDRYPKELSGGQQQRVAIARALSKDPKLILGDELTGNLDRKTSVDILNVLKEISKEKLVIVVSHNLDEADQFADRVIELHDGMILRDRARMTHQQYDFSIKGHVAYLPYFRDLTPEETKALEAGLRSGKIREIVQRDDGFVMSTYPKKSDRKHMLPRRHFLKKRRGQYTGVYTKKGIVGKALTVLIVTLMILCVSVFSSMHKIEHSEVPYDASEKYVPLIKGGLENPTTGIFSAYYYRVLDEEIEKAESISGAKVYKLLGIATSITGTSSSAGSTQSDMRRNFKGFYITETYGTLLCDEQFLIDKYGENGVIEYVEGSDPYSTKVPGVPIITDYTADALMKLKPDQYTSYEKIFESQKAIAIVKTGYKERYAEIIKAYEEYKGDDEYESLWHNLCKNSPLFEEYLREIVYSLGISYTFNENYVSDIFAKPDRVTGTVRHVVFERDGKVYPEDLKTTLGVAYGSYKDSSGNKIVTEKGQISMTYDKYNSIFGTAYTLTNYSTDFKPHKVTMKIYDRNVEGGVLLYEMEFEIIRLVATSNSNRVSKEDFDTLKEYQAQTIGLYVENNENIGAVASELSAFEYSPRSIAFDAIAGINKILTVFVPLFKLIAGGLYIFIAVYLINYAMQTIKKNYFQIGVFRSFGAKNSDVGLIFITGVVLTGLAIAILSVGFAPLIIDMYNAILVESFALVLNTNAFDIRVINMPDWLPIVNAIGVVVLTAASAIISLLVIKNLKPIEIIRAKDNGGEVS